VNPIQFEAPRFVRREDGVLRFEGESLSAGCGAIDQGVDENGCVLAIPEISGNVGGKQEPAAADEGATEMIDLN